MATPSLRLVQARERLAAKRAETGLRTSRRRTRLEQLQKALAFLPHTVLELCDPDYRAVRAHLPSRRTFFEHLRAVAQHWPFDSWKHLFDFMREALEPGIM